MGPPHHTSKRSQTLASTPDGAKLTDQHWNRLHVLVKLFYDTMAGEDDPRKRLRVAEHAITHLLVDEPLLERLGLKEMRQKFRDVGPFQNCQVHRFHRQLPRPSVSHVTFFNAKYPPCNSWSPSMVSTLSCSQPALPQPPQMIPARSSPPRSPSAASQPLKHPSAASFQSSQPISACLHPRTQELHPGPETPETVSDPKTLMCCLDLSNGSEPASGSKLADLSSGFESASRSESADLFSGSQPSDISSGPSQLTPPRVFWRTHLWFLPRPGFFLGDHAPCSNHL